MQNHTRWQQGVDTQQFCGPGRFQLRLRVIKWYCGGMVLAIWSAWENVITHLFPNVEECLKAKHCSILTSGHLAGNAGVLSCGSERGW